MNEQTALVSMLKQLRQDMLDIQQAGAGYYSCIPMIKRYNKLLGQARRVATESAGLMGTFDELEESEPKDPADKMKIIQGIRVEIGQLISLLGGTEEENA